MPRTLRPSGASATEAPELAAILDCVALPVWVVDHDGMVVFADPAGLAALGYDDLAELRGRPGHETIHYRRWDGSHFPAEECPMARTRGMGVTVREAEDWFIRRDGSMIAVSYTSTPIDRPAGQGAVVAFQDMTEQREAEQALREREAMLASVDQPVWVLDRPATSTTSTRRRSPRSAMTTPPSCSAGRRTRRSITSVRTARRIRSRRARSRRPGGAGSRCTSTTTGSSARTGR